MAYETGAATSPIDLLDKLRLFCLANGWTTNLYAAGTTNTQRLHMQKGSDLFVNLFATNNGTMPAINGTSATNSTYALAVNMSDGFNSANAWERQPGAPFGSSYYRAGMMSQLTGAMPAYHFFAYADSSDVLVALEYSTGNYQFMGFGKLALYTASAFGGQWFSGSCAYADDNYIETQGPDSSSQMELIPFRKGWLDGSSYVSTFVRCNVDSNDTWAGSAREIADSPTALAAVGQAYYDESRRVYTPSSLGWQTVMLRQGVYINRADSSMSPFGEIKHMRRLGIDNYLSGEEFTLGSDTWKVFPYRQKGGVTEQRGIAIRKVV